ncbi:MAG: ABC transporter permease [Acidobacteria bacterium]|nr:ABC transporter permease [Acidobacteriota bacterium]
MNLLKNLGFWLLLIIGLSLLMGLLLWSPWWMLPVLAAALALWLAVTRPGQQTASVLWVGIATIPQRIGSSAVIVVGIAGVVGVLVALLAMAAGFERKLSQTGSDDTVMILRSGALSESTSTLSQESVALITPLPYILKNSENKPIVSPEQLVVGNLPRKSTGLDARVGIRGVGDRVWELWPHIKITAGRRFTPGLRELVVGKDAQQEFAGLKVGAPVKFDKQPWTVVGIFDSGDAHGSEIWGDASVVSADYFRGGSWSSLTARLTDAGALAAFKAAVESDQRLKVNVQTTLEYYNRQTKAFTRLITTLGAIIGVIMAVGAIAGAVNATYTAIARRTREIATLRAVGFRPMPVLLSVLLETMLLAALGGIGGAAITWGIFDGFVASTAGASGRVVFALDVSSQLLWDGLKWALSIGFIGGVLPAIRATRVPIAAGLREL